MRQLLLIRHGLAETAEAAAAGGRDEFLRELTIAGRAQMRAVTLGLRAIIEHVDIVASSPLVRARQTAAIVAAAYGRDVVRIDALAPGGDDRALLGWLEQQGGAPTVAIVGHEPDLGVFASSLLIGSGDARLRIEKGAVLLLEFAGQIALSAGVLSWSIPAGVLTSMSAT